MAAPVLWNMEAKLKQLRAGVAATSPPPPWCGPMASSTPSQVLAELDALLAVFATAASAKAQATAAVAALRTAVPAGHAFYMDATQCLRLQLGKGNPALAACGVLPPKVPTPLTAAQKIVAVAKTATTRAARGIMSKQQRAQIRAATLAGPLVVSTATGVLVPQTPSEQPARTRRTRTRPRSLSE